MTSVMVLLLCACGREAPPAPSESPAMAAQMAPQSGGPVTPAPTKAQLAMPSDKAELQRLVDLGYTPHDDHLHAPGVKECAPMGGSMVQ